MSLHRPPKFRPSRRGILVLLLGLDLCAFQPAAAKPASVWTGVERIVAIGDLHGDFDHFVRLLQGTDLVDSDNNWIGKKAHLVQMGDIMDRGDYAIDILKLIRRLEKEAEAAGGMVHMLVGNHEEINLMERSLQYGREFVTLKQFFDFLPRSVRAAQERRAGGKLSEDQWWDIIANEGTVAKEYYSNFRKTYGNWIAEHNAVIKINDTVFVHGGLTEPFAAMGIQAINDLFHEEIKRAIDNDPTLVPRMLYRQDDPLWNRDLAKTDETAEQHAIIDRILASLKAKRIVVAHTPKISGQVEDMQRYGGKVWVIDTGISSVFHGHVWALVIEGGEARVVKRDRMP